MSLCDAPPGTQRAELVLSGLSCPACVRTVEEALRGVPGVESASVNLPKERGEFEFACQMGMLRGKIVVE